MFCRPLSLPLLPILPIPPSLSLLCLSLSLSLSVSLLCLSLSLSVSLFVSRSLSLCLCLCLSLSLSLSLSLFLCLFLSPCLLPVHAPLQKQGYPYSKPLYWRTSSLSLSFSLFLSVSLSLSVCLRLFLCLFLRLWLCLSRSLSFSVSLSLYLRLSLSLSRSLPLSLPLSLSLSLSLSSCFVSDCIAARCPGCLLTYWLCPWFPLHVLFTFPMMSWSCPSHSFQLPLPCYFLDMSASFSMYVPFFRCQSFPNILCFAFIPPALPLFSCLSLSCPFQFPLFPFHFPLLSCHVDFLFPPLLSLHFLAFPLCSQYFPQKKNTKKARFSSVFAKRTSNKHRVFPDVRQKEAGNPNQQRAGRGIRAWDPCFATPAPRRLRLVEHHQITARYVGRVRRGVILYPPPSADMGCAKVGNGELLCQREWMYSVFLDSGTCAETDRGSCPGRGLPECVLRKVPECFWSSFASFPKFPLALF